MPRFTAIHKIKNYFVFPLFNYILYLKSELNTFEEEKYSNFLIFMLETGQSHRICSAFYEKKQKCNL